MDIITFQIHLQNVHTTSLWALRPDQWVWTRSPAPTKTSTPAGSLHGSQAGPGSTVKVLGMSNVFIFVKNQQNNYNAKQQLSLCR